MAEAICDLCGCLLHEIDLQYNVHIEIRPTAGVSENEEDAADRDYLLELHETFERIDGGLLADFDDAEPATMNFLVCHECSRRVQTNPLPREVAHQLDFSEN